MMTQQDLPQFDADVYQAIAHEAGMTQHDIRGGKIPNQIVLQHHIIPQEIDSLLPQFA